MLASCVACMSPHKTDFFQASRCHCIQLSAPVSPVLSIKAGIGWEEDLSLVVGGDQEGDCVHLFILEAWGPAVAKKGGSVCCCACTACQSLHEHLPWQVCRSGKDLHRGQSLQGRLPTHLLCGMLPAQLLSSASSTVTT